jgi:tetratricopeptide (TPR) repeat protein
MKGTVIIMLELKCKMCGGSIQAEEGALYGTCDSCGRSSPLPKTRRREILDKFNRASELLMQCEFDRANSIYEEILITDGTDSEVYWGIVLCNYGIQYVVDPGSQKRIPTCHRMKREPVTTDGDYQKALSLASNNDVEAFYKGEAETISKIQKEFFEIADREPPYDVFICFKARADNGSFTLDKSIAENIYNRLVNDGCRVFFSEITLRGKLGIQYEPYIFAALNSAKIMLVIGTRVDYFNAIWVRNEWSRFLKLLKDGRSRKLIPCYQDMSANDIPKEFANFLPRDMSKDGFLQDLLMDIKKDLDADKTKTVKTGPTIESLTEYAWQLIKLEEWSEASEEFRKVIKLDPRYAPAHIGLFCAANRLTSLDKITGNETNEKKRLELAMEYADPTYRAELGRHFKAGEEQVQLSKEAAQRREYDALVAAKQTAATSDQFLNLSKRFEAMGEYEYAQHYAYECYQLYENKKAWEAHYAQVNMQNNQMAEQMAEQNKAAKERTYKILMPVVLVIAGLIALSLVCSACNSCMSCFGC